MQEIIFCVLCLIANLESEGFLFKAKGFKEFQIQSKSVIYLQFSQSVHFTYDHVFFKNLVPISTFFL